VRVPDAFKASTDAQFIVRFSAPGLQALEWSQTLGDLAKAKPSPGMATDLAEQEARTGNHEQAARYFEVAMAGDPDNAELLNNYAWSLVTWPENVRKPARAVELARKAVDLTKRQSWHIIDTLAEALLQAGKPAEAKIENDAALKMAPDEESLNDRAIRIRAALDKHVE
jgi:Tfp pilus assembly protein PilF